MKGPKYVWVGQKPLRVGRDTGWELLQGCKLKWKEGADEELWIGLIKGSSAADNTPNPRYRDEEV